MDSRFEQFFKHKRGRELLERFDPARLPAHVAVIMDGNGRWAAKRALPRAAGHRAGAKATEEVIGACLELGIRYLTIYSFSTENWRRSTDEVDTLMHLFVEVLKANMSKLMREGVRVRVIGRMSEMPDATRRAYEDAMADTAGNDRLDLIVALNYGGRTEIVDAARMLAGEVAAGALRPEDIDEDAMQAHLYTADIPDPDLVVRTSGELRVSNFLLWQMAYSELYVTSVLWPDFDRYDLLRAVVDYEHRERRFGGR